MFPRAGFPGSSTGEAVMCDHPSTIVVHGGEEREKPSGALTTPVIQSSTFVFRDTAEIREFVLKKEALEWPLRYEYGRYGHPTQTAVERKAAALEGAEQALLFSSGMAATFTTVLSFLSAGDHMIMVQGVYRRTAEFARQVLKRLGIETTFVAIDDPAGLEAAVRPNTRLLFAETPTNPYLRVMDLTRAAGVAKKHGLISVVDSTFATPINLRPLRHGFDLVLHSATKYLGGHNDLLAGLVAGPRALLAPVEELRGIFGPSSGAHDAYLLLRGMKTLELRIKKQNENGLKIARFLEQCRAVSRVYYPGLPSHPDHDIARRQMDGFGGVVSFEMEGDMDRAGRFIDRLRLPYIGPTLGGVESIIQQPALFVSPDPQKRRDSGMSDNLVRYALGIEDADDILADLNQALERS